MIARDLREDEQTRTKSVRHVSMDYLEHLNLYAKCARGVNISILNKHRTGREAEPPDDYFVVFGEMVRLFNLTSIVPMLLVACA